MGRINSYYGSYVSNSFPTLVNLFAHYDADDIGSITKDGSDFVSQLNDLSGNGHHLAQAVGARQPKWYANGMGVKDRALMSFDGLDDVLFRSSMLMDNFSECYVILVGNTNDISQTQDYYKGVDSRIYQRIIGSLLYTSSYIHVSSSFYNRYGGDLTTNDMILEQGGLSADRELTRINNTLLNVDFSQGSPPITISNPNTGFWLGNNSDGGTRSLHGDISEVIIIKGGFSAAERVSVYDYLNTKYEIY